MMYYLKTVTSDQYAHFAVFKNKKLALDSLKERFNANDFGLEKEDDIEIVEQENNADEVLGVVNIEGRLHSNYEIMPYSFGQIVEGVS